MTLALVDYLLYEKDASGILWIKFNRPERMNAAGRHGRGERHRRQGRRVHARRRRRPERAGHRADRRRPRLLLRRRSERDASFRDEIERRDRGQPRHARRPGGRAPALLSTASPSCTATSRMIRKPTIAMINGPAVGIGHGHGAALRHPHRLREDALRRLPPGRPDHRERRLLLSAEDGRPRPRAGVRLHRHTSMPSAPTSGACSTTWSRRRSWSRTTRDLCERIIALPPLVQWIIKRIMRAALDSSLETTMVLTSNAAASCSSPRMPRKHARPFARSASRRSGRGDARG